MSRLLFALVAAVLVAASGTATAQTPKPNVLLILADDKN